MDISSLIGGLGVGSVLTLVVKEYFENKKILSQRVFEEKRSAYVSYLDVVARTQNDPEGGALRKGATERVKLSANQETISRIIEFANAQDSLASSEKLDKLVQAMRDDLFPKGK